MTLYNAMSNINRCIMYEKLVLSLRAWPTGPRILVTICSYANHIALMFNQAGGSDNPDKFLSTLEVLMKRFPSLNRARTRRLGLFARLLMLRKGPLYSPLFFFARNRPGNVCMAAKYANTLNAGEYNNAKHFCSSLINVRI